MSTENEARHLLMSAWEYGFFETPGCKSDRQHPSVLWATKGESLFDTRSVKSSIIPEFDSGNSNEIDICCRRSSRNHEAKSRAQTAKMLYSQLCRFDCDPYLLVTPFCFGAEGGVAADLAQPFRVVVHPQCSLLCEIHSHLSDAEVIGLLAGRWDEETRILFVQLPFPCISTSAVANNGSTDVEMDPEAEYKARQKAESMGLQIIGWYHSHPKFRPNPSVIDIFNQQQYQSVLKDQPFLGLIISPYDKDCVDNSALHQWFVVKRYDDDVSTGEVYMPVKIDIEMQCYLQDIGEPILLDNELAEMLHNCNPITPVIDIQVETPVPVCDNVASVINIDENIGEENDHYPQRKKKKQSVVKEEQLSILILTDSTIDTDDKLTASTTSQENTSSTTELTRTISNASLNAEISPDSSRRSGRTKKPSEALLLMVEQKDQVFNERLPPKPLKIKTESLQRKTKKLNDTANSPPPITQKTNDSMPEKQAKTKEKRSEKRIGKKRKASESAALSEAIAVPIIAEIVVAKSRKLSLEETGPTLYNSIICSLNHPLLDSAFEGRRLLLATPLELQHVATLCLAMGFYYSRFKYRSEINSPWKGKRKLDKIIESSLYWLSFFQPVDASPANSPTVTSVILQRFAERVAGFFAACWSDYSGSTGKLRKGNKKASGSLS